MNYCDWAPRLSRTDKESVRNELRGKDNSVLIDLIFLVFEETQRVNNLLEKTPPPQLQRTYEALNQKYESLLKTNEELSQSNQELYNSFKEIFVKYEKLQSNYQEVVNHIGNIIKQYSEFSAKEFTKIIESKEEVLSICKNMQIHIQFESEYQVEIDTINSTLQEIYTKSKEAVGQMKTLGNEDEQIMNINQESSAKDEQQQRRSDKINSIISQINLVLEKSDQLILKTNSIKERSSDIILKQQMDYALSLLQCYIALFKRIHKILKDYTPQIEKYEKKVEYYKELLRKEQKYRVECQEKMEEYKKNYEKINQSRRQSQLNQQENQNQFIKYYFQIYQQYFILILNLIEIQNVQVPQIEQAIDKWKSQLSTQFTDLKSLIEFAQNQNKCVMQLANYISQQNRLKEILFTQNNFFNSYSNILKELSQR